MPRVAYVYLASISDASAQQVFLSLEPWGFQITHIGKHDPPKIRQLSFEEASGVVAQHDAAGTNMTFVADARNAIEVDFTIQEDSCWGFSTISISFPDIIPAQLLGEEIFRRLAPYAFICGEEGRGKRQQWEVFFVSEACPDNIKRVLVGEA